jgi:hypothetical protein
MVRLTGQRPRATWGRVLLACAAVLLLGTLANAPARAARPGLDASFGEGGQRYLELPSIAGVDHFDEERWVTAGEGSTYVLAAGSPTKYGTSGPEYLFRFDPDGILDRSFGGADHAVVLPKATTIYKLGVDAHGRVLVTRDEKGGQIWRYTKSGHLDPSFGHGGKLQLPTLRGGEVAVKPLAGGGLLAWVESFEGSEYQAFHLAKLSEGGRPLKRFGGDGVVTVDVPGEFHVDPVVTEGGAVLIGTTGCCSGRLALTRVSARGRLDSRFDRAARRSLRGLKKLRPGEALAEISAVLPRPGGGVRLLGGGFGYGFEMRLRADGTPVAGFGRRGAVPRPWSIEEALPVAGGEAVVTVAGYKGHPGVFLMSSAGTPDHRLSRRPIALPKKSYPTATLVGPGRVALTYSQSVGCDKCLGLFLAYLDLPTGSGR